MDVTGSMYRKVDAFYWATILVSNSLGTALGDLMADSFELGFGTRVRGLSADYCASAPVCRTSQRYLMLFCSGLPSFDEAVRCCLW